ncbi:MAG: hypothetical protein HKN46_00745 [Acidimicrobiia bacterium]|nr:hypothetical protein [Acidimicrobiia bacterium]
MTAHDHIPTNGPYGALAARLQAAQLVREAEEAMAEAAASPAIDDAPVELVNESVQVD